MFTAPKGLFERTMITPPLERSKTAKRTSQKRRRKRRSRFLELRGDGLAAHF